MIDRRLTHAIRPPDLMRIGRRLDGGYAIPAGILGACDAVVGLGIRDDWSFELAAAAGMDHCRCIHLYDPTTSLSGLIRRAVRVLPKLIAHAATLDRDRLHEDIHRALAPFGYARFSGRGIRHFREWAGGRDGVSLEAILARAVAAGARAIVLKIDIEGAEYALLGDCGTWTGLVPLIVAEFHGLVADPGPFEHCLRLLGAAYTPVHIHGNTGAGQLPCGFPCVPEVTFVRRDLLSPDVSPQLLTYPVDGLDQPNHRGQTVVSFEA